MRKRLERRIRATPSAPHPSYAYKLVSAPVRFARNSYRTRRLVRIPVSSKSVLETQNRFRCPAWIHVSEAANANWHSRFLQPKPNCLYRGLQYIPTECWFIQKFKDEIRVIGAQVPQEEPFGIENIHSPISVPYRVQLTPRGWCKVAAYDILRRKEVVKIRTTSPDGRKAQ